MPTRGRSQNPALNPHALKPMLCTKNMDKERLRKLKQQKELILRQLEWINLEIDQESTKPAPETSPQTSRLIEAFSGDRPVSPDLEIESAAPEIVASDLYDKLGPDTKNAASETKRGCLLISGIAFASFAALCAWVIYYY